MNQLLPQNNQIKTKDLYTIQELLYRPKDSIAHVIIVHGKNECLYKYSEFIDELVNKKIAVTVYDHRGQGFSDRILPNHDKCHINTFTEYTDDLELLIKNNNLPIPTFIIAISMGAAVTLRYLKDYKISYPLAGVILVSPFLGIKTFLPHFVLKLITKIKTLLSSATSYFYFKDTYKPRIFGINANTHDEIRHNRYFDLYNKHPEAKLGGMTNSWLIAAVDNIQLLNYTKWDLPVKTLIIASPTDNVVNYKSIIKFVNNHENDTNPPSFIPIQNSFHDILLEKDIYRNQAIKTIFDFILSLSKYQK